MSLLFGITVPEDTQKFAVCAESSSPVNQIGKKFNGSVSAKFKGFAVNKQCERTALHFQGSFYGFKRISQVVKLTDNIFFAYGLD